jgi:cytochrome c5
LSRRPAVLAVLLLTACAGSRLPGPTPADVTRAQARWPGTGLTELERGRDLYRARCSTCHLPVAPAAHPAAEWPDLVAEMAERAHLTGTDRDLVERYLVTMSTSTR